MTPYLDRHDVLQMLFYPRKETGPPPDAAQRISVSVEVGVRVYGYLYPAQDAGPLLLFFHGNGEIAADYSRLASLFAAARLSLLVMDYRGYGISDGQPTTSHLLQDAVTIFDALPAFTLRYPKKPFVMGRSLGSAAACELAQRRSEKIAGLVVDSGFASTRSLLARLGLLLDDYDEERDGHGNARKIASFRGPTLILHGQEDTLILAEEAKILYEISGSPDKRLLIVPNANHNNLMIAGYLTYRAALQSLTT